MKLVQAILSKAETLLTTEPARAIGYGAGAVIFLVVQVLNARGITRFGSDLTFEQAMGASFGAVITLAAIVESIRRFVYSPQTFIEELSDEWQNGHDLAHFEEEFNAAATDALARRRQAMQAQANEGTGVTGNVSIQTDKVQ